MTQTTASSPPTRFAVLRDHRVHVLLLLAAGLLLRLAHVLLFQPWPDVSGGDYAWYAQYGHTLVTTGWTLGPPPTGPLFLLVAGYAEHFGQSTLAGAQPAWLLQTMVGWESVFPNAYGGGAPLIRLLHSVLGTLTAWMAYRAGRAAFTPTAGLIALAGVTLGPAFILEAGNLTTESIALFLMMTVVALLLERGADPGWRLAAGIGVLLALAALTRSVYLAFPAIPIAYLLLRNPLRRGVAMSVVLLIAFFATISPWTIYNLITWDRFTLTGEGLLGTLYVGAVGWQDPAEVDETLGFEGSGDTENDHAARQEAFAQGFLQTVLDDPLGYAGRRLSELGGSLLQPHNTTVYSGESIKALVLGWLRSDRSLAGLSDIAQAEAFWPKLLLYGFHYTALILGAVGALRFLRRWRALWPLYAVLGYFLGIHLVLAAIPRYLFPLEPVWWLLAGGMLAAWITPHQAPYRGHIAPESA